MKLIEDRITSNFKLAEFANTEDGGAMILNPNVIQFIFMLQEFRAWYNRPMNITSGYRTKEFNKKCGGASNSYHLLGLAADFKLPEEYFSFNAARKNEFLNNIKNKWYSICKNHCKNGSVIWYESFVHLSWWPTWHFEDKR